MMYFVNGLLYEEIPFSTFIEEEICDLCCFNEKDGSCSKPHELQSCTAQLRMDKQNIFYKENYYYNEKEKRE